MAKADYRRVGVLFFESGLVFTVLLAGIKLDKGDLTWGGVFTPLTIAEMIMFAFSMSQCLIKVKGLGLLFFWFYV